MCIPRPTHNKRKEIKEKLCCERQQLTKEKKTMEDANAVIKDWQMISSYHLLRCYNYHFPRH
jgi:hypothetical protein